MELFEVTFSFLDPTQAVIVISAESEDEAREMTLERMKELPEFKILSIDTINPEFVKEQLKDVTFN